MVIFRIECEVDILLNIVFVSCKNNDIYDDSAYGFRYSMAVASGKTSVRFVTIVTMRELGFNMVFDHNFQETI